MKGGIGNPYDLVGIGFGPSNIALAICAREQVPALSCLFVEQLPEVSWHPGMLIDGARMQISFLKDLVTLRNPASPYSFLQYTKAKGRLEQFVNLGEFRPTRIEYNDYLKWVANDFAGQVRYRSRVKTVKPVPARANGRMSLFSVEFTDASTGDAHQVFARNIVYAGGGRPRIPVDMNLESARMVHSSQFLQRFPAQFDDRGGSHSFLVTGGGQSAGEIADYLLTHYPRSAVHLVVSGQALRPTDNSPFGNEQFYSHRVDGFYGAAEDERAALLDEAQDANYGVVREDLIEKLYHTAYLDRVKGERRLFVHSRSRLSDISESASGLVAKITDRFRGTHQELHCDGVILATGYKRTLDEEIFADMFPFIIKDGSGSLSLSRHHRVRTTPEVDCGFYVQGFGESQFGLGDTLLSLLPFRAKEILDDICSHRTGASDEPPAAPSRAVAPPVIGVSTPLYPPRHFLEDDPEKLYALMERFKFATLISSLAPEEPVATHLPLILDTSRGKGVLFGHFDRTNPHAALIDGRRMLAVFHGPDSYISPEAQTTDPLPTWNSMSVHVRGRVRVLRDPEAVVRGLCSISERSGAPYRLAPGDPRIGKLITYIVGFEFEIDDMVGRFKLSQDRDEENRRRAAMVLAQQTERGDRSFIEGVVGLNLGRTTS